MPLLPGNVVRLVLGEAVNEYRTAGVLMRHYHPISPALAFSGAGNPLLDQEATEASVNNAVLDLLSGLAERPVANSLLPCPAMESGILQQSDSQSSITP